MPHGEVNKKKRLNNKKNPKTFFTSLLYNFLDKGTEHYPATGLRNQDFYPDSFLNSNNV